MKHRIDTAIHITQALGVWLGGSRSTKCDIGVLVSRYLHDIDTKVSNEGRKQACKYFKSLHKVATEKCLHLPVSIIPFCKTKDGYPKELYPLRHLIEGSQADKQLALTVTRCYEKLVLPVDWKPEVITTPGPILSNSLLEGFESFAERFARNTTGIIRPNRPDTIMGSLTKGPNGPSILTSHYDASGVIIDPVLWSNLRKLSSLLGSQWIVDLIEDLGLQVPPKGYLTGRLALLQEGGGKTRTIAIGDYWTQNVLRPIHDKIMSKLRKMETDGTYDQENQFRRITKLTQGKGVYCFDLSSATDRFPVQLQTILMAKVFGREIAEAWRDVLIQRPFQYHDDSVRWGAGQPLGLLSSWAAFSLTHHCFIQWCAFQEGFKTFSEYALLGDDIAIWNERVAIRYQRLIEEIGVPINLDKSLTPIGDLTRVEFVKRVSISGQEITGLKFNLLSQSNTLLGVIDLIKVAKIRSYDLPWSAISVPPNHSSRWFELLDVLLIESYEDLDAPCFTRVTPFSPMYDVKSLRLQLRTIVRKLRIESIRDKQNSLCNAFDRSTPIETLFERGGVHVTKRIIGLEGWTQKVHPVVWALNKTGEKLAIALSMLETVPDGEIPDLLPCEYLPIPTIEVYFGDQHMLKSKVHSTFVVKAYDTISQMSHEQRIEIYPQATSGGENHH